MNFSAEVLGLKLAPLLDAGGPVSLAVALSGGADSAALLHAAAELARREPRLTLRALHVDHGLTHAAAPLAAAAAAQAAALGVPLRVLRVQVASGDGASIEAAARSARYGAFAAALREGESLLTAHHREDQAETLLLQLIRGAGLRGLAAMPAAAVLGRGRLLRPLLEMPQSALRAYAAHHGLASHEDPMNADPRYDRVYLRSRLWPTLLERWPEAAATIARSARHLAEAQALLDQRSAERLLALGAGPGLCIEGLLGLTRAERGELLRHWLARQGLRALSARRQAEIDRELLRAGGTSLPRMVWAGGELRSFAGFLYAFQALEPLALEGERLPRADAAPRALGALGRLEVAAVTGAGLRVATGASPFTMSHRAGGERLRLHEGAPRRALKDLLREARVPPWARERAILVRADALAAVVLPHATWIAAEYAAGPGEAGLSLHWRGAPAALMPAPARANPIEREPPFR